MNIWILSLHNIKSKPLYTFLSIFILSLSITLLLGVQQLKSSFENQIKNNIGDIDVVIGAKGSPLQLVLSSILHIDNPTGNISYSKANIISKHPRIKSAIPISYGDNYKGYRIIGTTDIFNTIYKAELNSGKKVKKAMEVVLGSTVAQQLNLKIGDELLSSHGLVENALEKHSDIFTVVGILKPTQKVIDRLILTNLQSIWNLHKDEKEAHHEEKHHHGYHKYHSHDEKEITSLLITFKSPRALLTFPGKINEGTNYQAVLPKLELDKLYDYTSIGFDTISWIGYLILIISSVIIFINLYKMVKERAFDLAVLRTYGASNLQLIKMVVYEAVFIAFLAFLIGFLCVKIGLSVLLNAMDVNFQKNIVKSLSFSDTKEVAVLIFMMIIISVSLALYPILKMNVATILSNEK